MTFQTSMILREDDLRDFCTKLLNKKKISYFSIPDSFWKWIHKNCNNGIKCWLYKVFGSLPDFMIFLPAGSFNLALMVELKRNGSYLRKNQKMASERLNWITVRTPEEFENTIDNLIQIQSHFNNSPIGDSNKNSSFEEKLPNKGQNQQVTGGNKPQGMPLNVNEIAKRGI